MTKIQITKLRNNGQASAKYIADDGRYLHTEYGLCVVFPENFKDAIQSSSVWDIEGESKIVEHDINGFKLQEEKLVVSKGVILKPPTRLLEFWLQKNIKTVGSVRAGKIVRNVYLEHYIEKDDLEGLLTISGVNEEIAREILLKFPKDETVKAINWFASRNLPVKIALLLSQVFKENAVEMVSQNPFFLTKINVPFDDCLKLAFDLGMKSDDQLVRSALAVDITKSYCRRTGSTVIPRAEFKRTAIQRGASNPNALLRASGELSQLGEVKGGYTYEGSFLVEFEIAYKLKAALNRRNGEYSLLAGWEKAVSRDEIVFSLQQFEKTIPFDLTKEQREAVIGTVRSKVCLLSGGAGTGKTTILRAILDVLENISSGLQIIQLALSGRASQRMSESTGREASTIAKFCIDMKRAKRGYRPEHCVVVIDEASMVDVYSMHQLLNYLPPATRFIFVGDDQQLPPVGGGLVFHALLQSEMPKFVLSQVKRQAEESGIHKFAMAIRNEKYLWLPDYVQNPQEDCSQIKAKGLNDIREIFLKLGQDTIVLCAMQNAKLGVRQINQVMQRSFGLDRNPILYFDHEHGVQSYVSAIGVRFYEDDPIMIAKNAYDIGVRNGDIGRIIDAYFEPEESGVSGILELNGRYLKIDQDLLEKMELAYAITIHKSQGSQWRNTIIVINHEARHMLDKTLIYTASTRATERLVLACPGGTLIENAINRGSVALQRKTNLFDLLKS